MFDPSATGANAEKDVMIVGYVADETRSRLHYLLEVANKGRLIEISKADAREGMLDTFDGESSEGFERADKDRLVI